MIVKSRLRLGGEGREQRDMPLIRWRSEWGHRGAAPVHCWAVSMECARPSGRCANPCPRARADDYGAVRGAMASSPTSSSATSVDTSSTRSVALGRAAGTRGDVPSTP